MAGQVERKKLPIPDTFYDTSLVQNLTKRADCGVSCTIKRQNLCYTLTSALPNEITLYN